MIARLSRWWNKFLQEAKDNWWIWFVLFCWHLIEARIDGWINAQIDSQSNKAMLMIQQFFVWASTNTLGLSGIVFVCVILSLIVHAYFDKSSDQKRGLEEENTALRKQLKTLQSGQTSLLLIEFNEDATPFYEEDLNRNPPLINCRIGIRNAGSETIPKVVVKLDYIVPDPPARRPNFLRWRNQRTGEARDIAPTMNDDLVYVDVARQEGQQHFICDMSGDLEIPLQLSREYTIRLGIYNASGKISEEWFLLFIQTSKEKAGWSRLIMRRKTSEFS